ncbi:hypothetical protein PV328_012111, partial [Microctonus aethiopoides]
LKNAAKKFEEYINCLQTVDNKKIIQINRKTGFIGMIMMTICKACEQIIRKYQSELTKPKIKQFLMNKIFHHIGMRFDNKVMNDHILAQNILDNHRTQLCKYVIEIDLNTLPMLSCTDVKCSWKQDHKRVLETYIPRPIEQHSCFRKKKEIKYMVTPAQGLKMQEIFKNSCLSPLLLDRLVEGQSLRCFGVLGIYLSHAALAEFRRTNSKWRTSRGLIKNTILATWLCLRL